MRGTIHLVAILLTALSAGCTTTVDVVFDERQGFSQHRTWDWSSITRPIIDAPDANAEALEARMARLIEQRLHENGFRRAGDRAEFFVTYQLSLRRQTVIVNEPSAIYELSSHHASGSFTIEGTNRVARVYEGIHLAIGVTGARGRTVWRAELTQQAEDIFALKLDEAVATLLELFPQHRPRNDVDSPSILAEGPPRRVRGGSRGCSRGGPC